MSDRPDTPHLDRIHSPADLRGLSVSELRHVPQEIMFIFDPFSWKKGFHNSLFS